MREEVKTGRINRRRNLGLRKKENKGKETDKEMPGNNQTNMEDVGK